MLPPTRLLALASIGAALAACTPSATRPAVPDQPAHLPYRIVSRNGPVVPEFGIAASTSVTDLVALIGGYESRRSPAAPIRLDSAWSGVSVPPDSLLVALFGDGRGYCSVIKLTGVDLMANGLVNVERHFAKASCTQFANRPSSLWLLAIPRDRLPARVITVAEHRSGDGLDANFRLNYPWDFRSVVDLRTWTKTPPDSSQRANEVRSAIVAAEDDYEARLHRGGAWGISEFGARGFGDASTDCASMANAKQASIDGYVVVLYDAVSVGAPVGWTTKEYEYFIVPSGLSFCGSI